MDKETRLEVKLRTLKLDSYNVEAAKIDAAELASIKLFHQTHEQVDGRRVKMTKRRKIAKHNAMIDKIFSAEIDVLQDSINQLTALDA